MFEVGDHIVYPMHGAGKIKAIEEKEISGEKQEYYIINMLIGDMRVMFPKNKIAKSNIRPVLDLDEVKEIVVSLEDREIEENLTWKKRNKLNTDKIESGDLQACAEVVYSLLKLQREDKLNSSERSMLKKAKQLLMSELQLVKGMTKEKMKNFTSILREEPLVLQ